MTMEEVKKNLRENKYKPEFLPVPPIRRYPDDHVFDETKSVVWHREEVIRRNEEYVQAKKLNREREHNMDILFSSDLREALKTDYGFSSAQVEFIYQNAYEEGHANGYYEVLYEAEKLADLVTEFMKL